MKSRVANLLAVSVRPPLSTKATIDYRARCGDESPNKSSDNPKRLGQSAREKTPTTARRATPLAKQLPLPYGWRYAK